ncbi:MAG: glycosyltransferase family 4 protein [Parvicellaceae bacterium]
MKKILFLAHHRIDRSPGQRYRFEQFFDYLELKGIQCFLANIINEKDEIALYHSKSILKKIKIGLNSYKRRWIHTSEIHQYDLIVIYREVLPTKSIYFEKYISKNNIPIVYDFDDAIWVKDVSEVNKKISFLKDEKKIEKILPLCKHITCGNEYLANFARKINPNVTIIPSTVDTDLYKPIVTSSKSDIVKIGWVGSHTTVKHFEMITDVYLELKKKFKNKIEFVLIGDEQYHNKQLGIKGVKWENKKEVELFNSFDIGIMPIPNNEWSKGKCGMKGLLYMSVGIPTVMSAVGMNKKIIQNGKNGFLANKSSEWLEILSNLIENKNLRKKVGAKGRDSVEKNYSKNVVKETYFNLYTSLMK